MLRDVVHEIPQLAPPCERLGLGAREITARRCPCARRRLATGYLCEVACACCVLPLLRICHHCDEGELLELPFEGLDISTFCRLATHVTHALLGMGEGLCPLGHRPERGNLSGRLDSRDRHQLTLVCRWHRWPRTQLLDSRLRPAVPVLLHMPKVTLDAEARAQGGLDKLPTAVHDNGLVEGEDDLA